MAKQAMAPLWAWFSGELSSLVPGWFGAMFLGAQKARALSFDEKLTAIEDGKNGLIAPAQLLSGPMPGLAPVQPWVVDAALPSDFFLIRRVEVPVAAARSLHSVAGLDLIRRTPFTADEVFWALSPPKRDGEKMIATQWVARKSDVAALRKRLADIGLTLRRVSVEGAPDAGSVTDLSGSVAGRPRRWRLVNGVLASVVVFLALAVWLRPGWQAQQALGAATERVASLRTEAVALRQSVDAQRLRETERSAFIDLIIRRPRLADTLRELTVALPDDTWLGELSYRPPNMVISGETSGSAAQMVLTLADARAFTDPRLSGPVSRTAQGAERFELSLGLRGSE